MNQGMLSDSAESIPFGLKKLVRILPGELRKKVAGSLLRCFFLLNQTGFHSVRGVRILWPSVLGVSFSGGPVGVIEDNKQLSAVNLAPWDRGRLSKHWLESLGPLVPTMRRRADRRGKKKRRKTRPSS